MEIKTEQFKFDLGQLSQKIQEHLKEVFQHLIDTKQTKKLNGITFKNDNDRLLQIMGILPDLSLLVVEFEEFSNNTDEEEMSIENIDAYELISLLDYINANILRK